MYAIVDVAGQQFKVEKDQKIYVHRLEGKEGDAVEFNRVLLIEDGDHIVVGEPIIEGALVSGKILDHLKGDKVKIFKKKKRKGYQILRGHRQSLSQVLIEEIAEKGVVRKAKVSKEVADSVPGKKAEVKPAVAKEKKAPAKKTVTAKAVVEKPGPKTPARKKSPGQAKTSTGKTVAATKPPAKTTARKSAVKKDTAGKAVTPKSAAKKASPKKTGTGKKAEK